MPSAAAVPVDQHLVLRLRLSLARLLVNGDALATTFYGLLFERYPSVRRLFPDEMEHQRKKLMQSLAWVVTHMDRPAQIVPALRELGRRHVGYGSQNEHYPLVRDTLIEAMGRTAGADWNPEIEQDWRQSIDLIARHMMAGAAAAAAEVAATSTVSR